MRYNKSNYNRLSADNMYEWNDQEWIVDKNGQIRLWDDAVDNEMETVAINPLYSIDENSIDERNVEVKT